MSKCICCGFENSENCTFCAICGHPVEDNGFYVHSTTNNSDISVEELNKKIVEQDKKENQATKSFKKLDKNAISKESAKIDDTDVKEYKTKKENTNTLEKTPVENNTKSADNKSCRPQDKTPVENNAKNINNKPCNQQEKTPVKKLQQAKPMLTDPADSKLFNSIVNFLFGTKDITDEFDNDDIEENCIMAIISYIPFLFFVPMIIKPRSGYLRFHGTQGLTMFLASLCLEFFNMLLNAIISSVFVNMVGSILTILITVAINMYILLMISIGIANSVKGIARELPIIGKYKLLKP